MFRPMIMILTATTRGALWWFQYGNMENRKYVVKHKSSKLLMTYAVGKLEVALNMSHLILSQRELVS